MSKPRWIKLPLAQLTEPPRGGAVMVYRDRWWLVDTEGNALFFKSTGSPQCNNLQAMVERIAALPRKEGIECSARFVPLALVPIDFSDYV